MNTSDAEQLAQRLLAALVQTAKARDVAAHMGLISPAVNVFGVPGFEVIGYEDWARQCQHEFEQGLLAEVRYEGMRVVSATAHNILFKTVEIVRGSDGTTQRHGVEILIRKEADDVWRIAQERILPEEEMEFDRAKPGPFRQ